MTRRFDEYYKNPDEDEGFGKLPDLILLDGGKGQVAAVKEVLQSKNIDVPLFGLVKDDKHRTRAVTGEAEKLRSVPDGRCLRSSQNAGRGSPLCNRLSPFKTK